MIAAKSGKKLICQMYFDEYEEGLDIDIENIDGWTALMLASHNGYTSIVDMLIKKKAELNHCDRLERNSLHYAARYNNIKMALYLIN